MKRLFCLVLLPFAVACVGETDTPPSRPTIVAKDTNLLQPKAQNPYAPVDLSPMDIAYYPAEYPVMKMSGKATGDPMARVIYSRPQRQGRTIFGALLKYGEPWRLGANEATEIEIFQPVTIQGKKVAKGRYTLYSIPHEDKWTIVFNSNLYNWGLRPDPSKDVYRFDVPVRTLAQPVEFFTMVFQNTPDKGTVLLMAWDTVEAQLPIQ